MSRKPPRRGNEEAPKDTDDQIALFASPAPKAKMSAKELSPARRLSGLISQIARLSGLHHAEVNRRLNLKLGVSTRTGASDALIERALELAEEYLRHLAARQCPPLPEPAAPLVLHPKTASRKGPPPTPEQDLAVEVKLSGEHFAVQAGAGTGKTATLVLLAHADRHRGVFLAFNRSVVDDAARRFPPNVHCRTPHSIAMKALASRYGERYGAPREPAWRAGERLGIARTMKVTFGERVMTHKALSSAALGMVVKFCHSNDTDLSPKHLPYIRGLDNGHRPEVARFVLPYAKRAWEDLQNPDGRKVKLDPNHALKIWAMTKPVIPGDFLLLDEAQDTNPVLEEVFNAQRSHAQLIMVGDSAQAIYGWRGARDVMTGFDGRQLVLSQSFRFGPALAEEANRWLDAAGSPIRLRGNPALDTTIGPIEQPEAILCRTNAGTITETFRLLEEGKRVALVGSAKALEELARAAGELKAGRRTAHPELVLFQTWGELQEYAEEDPMGGDLLPLVDIIDTHGAETVLRAVQQLTDESVADVVLSTAHKAKGREWLSVKIAEDFEPQATSEVDANGRQVPRPYTVDDYRLAYVSVTRARQRLDRGGLQWIDKYPDLLAGPVATMPPRSTPEPPARPPALSPWDRLGPPPMS
ncbi:UvrD-helicase domain-containing protein [Streptomyces sp. HNM0663]|uniref:UvrD-helicase domain-containing protein n=1 Tax=Streptomyces chengmaiensis TaxID=3040919 RepID=A0ABT6HW76_9ACTN|nr:UvrD-helicase domain-containing protein [Streptomyces chengmaiensis]MDH2392968.1 UvrD-helicase domain-containing protein [Streptomyces chengmaiensis]